MVACIHSRSSQLQMPGCWSHQPLPWPFWGTGAAVFSLLNSLHSDPRLLLVSSLVASKLNHPLFSSVAQHRACIIKSLHSALRCFGSTRGGVSGCEQACLCLRALTRLCVCSFPSNCAVCVIVTVCRARTPSSAGIPLCPWLPLAERALHMQWQCNLSVCVCVEMYVSICAEVGVSN